MQVTSAELAVSAAGPGQFPAEGLPEIALVGRSNVGKSSLINALLGRKGLARTSSQPGKTRLLNFYRINGTFYFVDLPGYGYAKVSKAERARWDKLIAGYLLHRRELRCVLQLVDLRHEPMESDAAMQAWLKEHGLPVILVATKADKIARGRWQQHLARIRAVLAPEHPAVLFSAATGAGKEELWQAIEAATGAAGSSKEQRQE